MHHRQNLDHSWPDPVGHNIACSRHRKLPGSRPAARPSELRERNKAIHSVQNSLHLTIRGSRTRPYDVCMQIVKMFPCLLGPRHFQRHAVFFFFDQDATIFLISL